MLPLSIASATAEPSIPVIGLRRCSRDRCRTDGLALVQQLLHVAPVVFPRDRKQLSGRLDDVKSAAALDWCWSTLKSGAYLAMRVQIDFGGYERLPIDCSLDSNPRKPIKSGPIFKDLFLISLPESLKAIQPPTDSAALAESKAT